MKKKVSCKDTCCHTCMRSVETCAELEKALGRCNQMFGSRNCKQDQITGAECPEYVKQK